MYEDVADKCEDCEESEALRKSSQRVVTVTLKGSGGGGERKREVRYRS